MSCLDVAVIGGGLAGCSAAITLAQTGAQVALFEAKAYPHHKVCGEFMSPECVDLLADLGVLTDLQALRPAAIDRARITLPGGGEWAVRLPGAGIGISRFALDAVLADRARSLGVAVHERTPVNAVRGNLDSGFTVTTRANRDFHARAVIGAYGKRAALDRSLNRTFLQTPQPFVGLKMHFRGPSIRDTVELHTFPGGYCGLSDIEGGLVNACLLVQQTTFQRAGGPEPFITWMAAQNPALGDWLRHAEPVHDRWLSISQIPFVPKTTVERDVLMAGDTAGLIAPLAGNGMSMALRGGVMAAQHISHFLNGTLTPANLVRQYTTVWQHEFHQRLRLGRWLQTLMFRPQWLGLGLGIARIIPPLGRYFVDHTRAARLINSEGV